jgi:hypothetical protein
MAACALLAAGAQAVAPAAARAEAPAASPGWQLDTSLLLYDEREQARVLEPVARISRLFGNGHRVSAQLGFDAITGASPSGALPSGQIQTTTTPSGNVAVTQAGKVPMTPFRDDRYLADASWEAPLSRTLRSTLGFHFSGEKDYRSIGATTTVSIDLMERLTTVTAGAGYNHDSVFPSGGTRAGLADSIAIVSNDPNPKNVTTGMLGVSRVLSRRWLVGVTGSIASEEGYLTEPYKVVSLVDATTGDVSGQVTEKRPGSRMRASVLANSVYHLSRDILYLSYRYYGDDWDVRSHTADARYRFEFSDTRFLQPHVRYYRQTAARFYAQGLDAAAPLPDYASSDYRLGPLRTATVGLTYGFGIHGLPGTLSVRAEYVRQWLAGAGGGESEGPGDDDPPGGDDVRAGPSPDAAFASILAARGHLPPVHIGSLLVGYSISF